MKLLFTLALFFACYSVYSQASLVKGKWLLEEMKDDELYFNVSKDSVGFTQENPSDYAKKKMQEQTLKFIRHMEFQFLGESLSC